MLGVVCFPSIEHNLTSFAFSSAKLRETFEISKSFFANKQKCVNFLTFVNYVHVHDYYSVNIY